jgi:maltooligosyltrehalose trehalohydrolase
VGNRPFGDRLDALAGPDGARVAATLVLLSPFTPLLWMGEEYAETAPFLYFVSHTDPELIQAVRRGRREEFADLHADTDPPDPQDPGTFARSKLNWEARRTPGHAERLAYYTELLRLRRELRIIENATAARAMAWDPLRAVAILYRSGAVVANAGDTRAHLALPLIAGGRIVLDSGDARWGGQSDAATIEHTHAELRIDLPPRTALVLAAQPEDS